MPHPLHLQIVSEWRKGASSFSHNAKKPADTIVTFGATE
jgi:hypothetical protein